MPFNSLYITCCNHNHEENVHSDTNNDHRRQAQALLDAAMNAAENMQYIENEVDDLTYHSQIADKYEKVVTWQRNLFNIPFGQVGGSFVDELAKIIGRSPPPPPCNGNPVGFRGQRGDRKIQGRQKMCRNRGSNPGLRNWPPAPKPPDHRSTTPPDRATELLTCFRVPVTPHPPYAMGSLCPPSSQKEELQTLPSKKHWKEPSKFATIPLPHLL